MNNLIKGFITTALGFIIFLSTLAHWSGFYKFPNPDFLDTDFECILSLILSAFLMFTKETVIEEIIINAVKSIINKFFGNGNNN